MTDNYNGSPLPNPAATPNTQGNKPRSSPTPHNQPKRNQRPPKNQSQHIPQVDGTVSDSVTNPLQTPRSKKANKQRQQSHAVGAPAYQNGNMGHINGHKPRPVSLGGNMLPNTPLKEQAYAGPTFQASPAPSSLPVPKFFSKSVPNVAQQSLEARMAGNQTPEKESSPEPDVVSPVQSARNSQQSPLDFFFQADREEKERSRSGSNLSPEIAYRQQTPTINQQPQSGKHRFLSELNGDSGVVTSPRNFSQSNQSPHNQRATSSGAVSAAESGGESDLDEATNNLKNLIFGRPQNSTPPNSNPQHPRNYSNPHDTPSPFQRSTSGPSTPTPSAEQQNQHYSLHYGNRNLSPLFKAARNETPPPPRPSGLRQQELASDVNANNTYPQQQQPPPQIDPNSFSRNYLNQHIQQRPSSQHNPVQPPLPPNIGPNDSGGGVGGVPTGTSPRTAADAKVMEDDLRRMLNLNVLSN